MTAAAAHYLDTSPLRQRYREPDARDAGAVGGRPSQAVSSPLTGRGVLLIADLVEQRRPEARALFAESWDALTEAQSVARTGSAELFEKFGESKWNNYRFPDYPFDQPSPLFDQLTWLKDAGFA